MFQSQAMKKDGKIIIYLPLRFRYLGVYLKKQIQSRMAEFRAVSGMTGGFSHKDCIYLLQVTIQPTVWLPRGYFPLYNRINIYTVRTR
jgi:hypothetical protein